LLCTIGGLCIFFITELMNGIQFLIDVIPKYFTNLVIFSEQFITKKIIPIYEILLSHFHKLDKDHQETIINNINHLGTTMTNLGTKFITNILLSISSFIRHLPTTATVFIFFILSTFFISKDWEKLIYFSNQTIPV